MINEELLERELTAEDIFSADDLTLAPYQVPEWTKGGKPGVIFFKVMSAADSIRFQEEMAKSEKAKRDVIVRIMAECACDSQGQKLFKQADMEKLRNKSTAVYLRMQKFLLQLNGMMAPEKSWSTVRQILIDCGIDSAVVALVKQKWDVIDSEAMTETVKNV
jgi:hypothetical protein